MASAAPSLARNHLSHPGRSLRLESNQKYQARWRLPVPNASGWSVLQGPNRGLDSLEESGRSTDGGDSARCGSREELLRLDLPLISNARVPPPRSPHDSQRISPDDAGRTLGEASRNTRSPQAAESLEEPSPPPSLWNTERSACRFSTTRPQPLRRTGGRVVGKRQAVSREGGGDGSSSSLASRFSFGGHQVRSTRRAQTGRFPSGRKPT